MSLLSEFQANIVALISEAESCKLLLTEDVIDHVGTSCVSFSEFEKTKSDFLTRSTLLGEVEINGRPIATFKCHEPLLLGRCNIDILELAAPKPDGSSTSGFDHIEVVINESFGERKARSPEANWSSIRWPSLVNPEVVLSLPGGKIKYHFRPLESVIQIEHRFPQVLAQGVPAQDAFDVWIFDLDGTLADSAESLLAGAQEFCVRRGLVFSKDELISKFKPTYAAFLAELGIDCPTPEDWNLLAQCEASHAELNLKPVPAMIELAKEVKSTGKQTVLWTARFRPAVTKMLRALGLESTFDVTLTASEVEKPSALKPEILNEGPRVLIGDSSSDEVAARLNHAQFFKVPSAHLMRPSSR